MLHYADEVVDKIEEITRRAKRKKQAPMETAKELLAVEPTFGPALTMMGLALEDAGDLEQAEETLWKALALGPNRGDTYIYLAAVIAQRRPEDRVAERLHELGFWKFSMADEIKPETASFMRPIVKNAGPATDPYTYGMFAGMAEARFNDTYGPAAAEEDERLAPFQVLNDLEREADLEIEPATLKKVLDDQAQYAPLLHGALREWSNMNPKYRALDLPALSIFAALLGEIGGPELIGDLLELAEHPDEPTFLHVHWAIHRLGQRFPQAALATYRAATREASPGLLCALAEQLNLLPEIEGVAAALAGLMDDFPRIAKDDDAAYLLAMVTDAMAERGEVEKAHDIVSRCEPFLSKEGRTWVEETINGDEDFVPDLVEQEIARFDIEEVCLERVFMNDEEEEIDDGEFPDGEFEDDEFEGDEDDEFEDDWPSPPKSAFTPRVGRNDPCWCGSGKKYKKCHLPADEEAHFAR